MPATRSPPTRPPACWPNTPTIPRRAGCARRCAGAWATRRARSTTWRSTCARRPTRRPRYANWPGAISWPRPARRMPTASPGCASPSPTSPTTAPPTTVPPWRWASSSTRSLPPRRRCAPRWWPRAAMACGATTSISPPARAMPPGMAAMPIRTCIPCCAACWRAACLPMPRTWKSASRCIARAWPPASSSTTGSTCSTATPARASTRRWWNWPARCSTAIRWSATRPT
ncbi:hypothetical protein D3C72_1231980 [compost metagenome]